MSAVVNKCCLVTCAVCTVLFVDKLHVVADLSITINNEYLDFCVSSLVSLDQFAISRN